MYKKADLTKTRDDELLANAQQYQRLIRKLLWLVRGMRPDIAFVIPKLSQHCQKPANRHYIAAQRVIEYLNWTITLGIVDGDGGKSITIT